MHKIFYLSRLSDTFRLDGVLMGTQTIGSKLCPLSETSDRRIGWPDKFVNLVPFGMPFGTHTLQHVPFGTHTLRSRTLSRGHTLSKRKESPIPISRNISEKPELQSVRPTRKLRFAQHFWIQAIPARRQYLSGGLRLTKQEANPYRAAVWFDWIAWNEWLQIAWY